MKRSVVAAAALGSVGVAAVAFRARKRDVTHNRASTSRSVTVRKNAEELYALWRCPSQLSRFLRGVSVVDQVDDECQRWAFDVAGKNSAFDSRIVDDQPEKRIEWRVGENAPFEGQIVVTFAPLEARDATEVRMIVAITGPGARGVSAFARLFGASVEQVAMESLRGFKALAEAGEIPKAVRD